MINKNKKGFTLLEMLLVIAIIAILAGIVIVAINPAKQLADANNAKRQSDVLAILNAIHQYGIDNQGDLSGLSLEDENEECSLSTGTDAIDLEGDLVDGSVSYISAVPTDPQTGPNVSSYIVTQNSSGGRITVCAPLTQGTDGAIESDSDNFIKVTR
ncbi:MAG TPA: prepilin-type N-terminal cleavage/methylation domain-containing protein [Candidatus Paceibacterota bacterium]|nr:prepilin-type N-terminal cleavage/methylation domain-containing protein [Candidatus Paceibacterota bacterium]